MVLINVASCFLDLQHFYQVQPHGLCNEDERRGPNFGKAECTGVERKSHEIDVSKVIEKQTFNSTGNHSHDFQSSLIVVYCIRG